MPQGAVPEPCRNQMPELAELLVRSGRVYSTPPVDAIGSMPEGRDKSAALEAARLDTERYVKALDKVVNDKDLQAILKEILGLRELVLSQMMRGNADLYRNPHEAKTSRGDLVDGGPFLTHRFYADLISSRLHKGEALSVVVGVETEIRQRCRTDLMRKEVELSCGRQWMLRDEVGSDPYFRHTSKPTRAGFFASGEGFEKGADMTAFWRTQAGEKAPIRVTWPPEQSDLVQVNATTAREMQAGCYADLGIERGRQFHTAASDRWVASVSNGFWYRGHLITPSLENPIQKEDVLSALGDIRELVEAILHRKNNSL